MSHFFPAYIGKPPPHVLRKRRQREQEELARQEREDREEREREERDRELSPEVPEPEPSTPAHFERTSVFGTPTRSVSRVRKTYAHKRARSFATPRMRAGSDGEHEQESQTSSREPSSSRSPTKAAQKKQAQDTDSARPAKRPRLNEYDDDDMYADPPMLEDAIAPVASPSHSPVRRPQQNPRAGSPEAPEPQPSTRRPRGRPPKVKPIAIPTPSTTSEEGVAQNAKRRSAASGTEMTLSEALNQSFAHSLVPSPVVASSSRARKARNEQEDMRDPSHAEPTPVKRGPGRPRGSGRGRGRGGRGRGRGAGSSEPFASHDADNVFPPASAHESEASMPTWTTLPTLDRGAASSHRPPHPLAREEEEEGSDDELASVTQIPVKRTPGRPRRPATPGSSSKAGDTQPVKRRGRPPGSKNPATLAREAAAAEVARRRASLPNLPASSTSIMANYAAAHGPPPVTPVKRGRGRPRKSAPEPSVFGLDTVDYMEPLKDPDADVDDNPFRRRTRSQSRTRGSARSTPAPSPAPTPRRRSVSATRAPRTPRRNNSKARPEAAPPKSDAPKSSEPPSHYLDMKTMEWKPRARSTSTSPPKRRARPTPVPTEMPKATEFQTRTQLCNALKRTLLEAPMPKLKDIAAENEKQQRRQQKEKERLKRKRDADRLKVAPSGVLFFGSGDKSEAEPDDEDDDDEEQGDAMTVFCGSWSVLADPAATFDDSLAMKTLHEVVMGVRAYIELEKAAFAKSHDGQTISVTVPCGCMSVRGRTSESPEGGSSSSLQPPAGDAEQCAGKMVVSVTQELIPEGFSGVGKAMRMTVMISHY
ncbi:transcription factor [Ganoderma sinense ZZ0214-1]|uniref:Transcription factor n=1 Tax=Ganoderma sinense ZZ0214-1 TaxID=1077348 RepID=A0A2G8SFQ5_9APHY|nr:transcription factor [Ganoderma sinense ZZ0214-1]